MSSIADGARPRKGNAPPIFSLPSEFQPEEFLPRRLRRRGDDARWAVSTIVNKMAHHRVDRWGYARLSSSILRKTMSWRTQPAVMRALVASRWLDPPVPYYPGIKSKGYRLSKRALVQGGQRVGVVLDAFESVFEDIGVRLVVKSEVPVESPPTHLHTAA